MRRSLHIVFALVVALVVVGSCNRLPRPAATPNPPAYGHPLKRGKAAHEALEGIDSLMWWRADSALAVMMEFAGSEEADSMDAFEGLYCQVLIAELLFKNDYKQSNRTEVLKAVGYFDSIDNAFLAARAHYIKGVGYYERDN